MISSETITKEYPPSSPDAHVTSSALDTNTDSGNDAVITDGRSEGTDSGSDNGGGDSGEWDLGGGGWGM